MKPTVSTEMRQHIIELRRTHSLRQVADITGAPIGTVKTICSRSGAFRDNLKHRAMFTLPAIVESQSTALAIPEMPAQQVVTGDNEVDAILWLQQVVSTGQPDLIAKAMEARKRIKTPMKQLEKRYLNILIAQNPDNAMGVAFSTFGFGELELKAKHAVSRNVLAREALARFGSETGVFTNTPAEDFIIAALAGICFQDTRSLPGLTDGVIAAFRAHPDYMPNTLTDCLAELAYWNGLYRLRNSVDRDMCGDGLREEWVRRDFVFSLMRSIRPRSKAEALAVMHYMLDKDTDAKGRDGADDILLNLIGGAMMTGAPATNART